MAFAFPCGCGNERSWLSQSAKPSSKISSAVSTRFGCIFDVAKKQERLEELDKETLKPGFWDDQERAQKVQRQRSAIESLLNELKREEKLLEDAGVLLELGLEAKDESVDEELAGMLASATKVMEKMEFRRMMSGPHDPSNAIIEIHSGAGGTDAQDWAQMLLRMYTRWCERRGFAIEQIDLQPGEEVGVKGATIIARGDHAFGWLRAENGVHRLVRISPFDANHRRHTAFASVFIFPELEEEEDEEVDWENDVREDTYRSGGAGGQHVNKTESAIRLTHIPTGLVVQCQSERSQHKNRSTARKILSARIRDLREKEQAEERAKLAGTKLSIGFGSQIRSYVAQPYRLVKDHRTGFEDGNLEGVLDGNLDGFMEAYLLSGGKAVADAGDDLA
jgi:peptide chain release factor 2